MFRCLTLVLQPTARQARLLEALLEGQRELYNAALEERRGAWAWERRRVTKFDQYRQLTELRQARPEVFAFGLTVCRGTLNRLDEAFAGFFRRVRAGGRPGHPRFRGRSRWDSVSWPDKSGWRVEKASGSHRGRLYLQGIDHIRAVGSRCHPEGEPKTLTVRRRGRRWEASVFIEVVCSEPAPRTGRAVGLDMGVANLVAIADTEGNRRLVENPRPRAALAEALAAAQADRARRQRGSRRYRATAATTARIKAKEARIRRDTCHKLAKALVGTYDTICYEDLAVANMVRSARGTGEHPGTNVAAKAGLNNAIADSGWAGLIAMIAYKAEGAGRQTITVNPQRTSQRCAACGHLAPDNRVNQALFQCHACGRVDHADLNAADNILRAGLALREAESPPNEKPGSTPAATGRAS